MKRLFFYFTIILCIVLGFTSCRNKVETTNLKLNLVSTKPKTILPKTPVVISYYIVEGKGPNNNTFNIRTTKTKLNIEGLAIGQWMITATGCNTNDIPLVKGNVTMSISKSKKDGAVYLDKLIGKGSLKVKLSWYTNNNIKGVRLNVHLYREGETIDILNSEEIKVDYDKREATIYKVDIPSGSYKLVGDLKADTTTLAGFAEAIRIINGSTSGIGTVINMHVDEASSSGNVEIGTNMEAPIQGEIAGVDENINLGTSITASFQKGNHPIENVRLEWYYDGQLKSNDKTYTFTPKSGSHRLDCIVYRAQSIGSCGSASVMFKVTPIFENHKPVLIDSLTLNQKGMDFTNVNEVKFIDDKTFISATNEGTALNLCTITQDQIFPLKLYNDPIFKNIEGIETNDKQSLVAFAIKDKTQIHSYQLNKNTYKLEKRSSCIKPDQQWPEHAEVINSSILFKITKYYKPTISDDGKFMIYSPDSVGRINCFGEIRENGTTDFRVKGAQFANKHFDFPNISKTYAKHHELIKHSNGGYMCLSQCVFNGYVYLTYYDLKPGYIPNTYSTHRILASAILKSPEQITTIPVKYSLLTDNRILALETDRISILDAQYDIQNGEDSDMTFVSRITNKAENAEHLEGATDMDLNHKKNMIVVSVRGGVQFFEINSDYSEITASHFVDLGVNIINSVDFSSDGKYVIACSKESHKVFLIKMPKL